MLSNKFLDPKNDIAFKKIFGTEKNKDILIHFLNDMLVFREKKPIVDVTFLKTVQDPEIAVQKTSLVDVLCKDSDGSTYVVEMQVALYPGFEKRAQYYAAKAYVSQMHKGGKYENLKEVVFLAILGYTMFPYKKAFKSDHIILDKNTFENDLKDFSFTFLELSKFTKTKEELSCMVDKWAYYFKHADDMTAKDLDTKEDEAIKRAYEELKMFYWDSDELFAYEQEQKREWDNLAVERQKEIDEEKRLMEIKKNLMEAKEKALAQGMEKGREEGIAEGMKLTINSMIKKGKNLSEIADLLDLTKDEVEKIVQ